MKRCSSQYARLIQTCRRLGPSKEDAKEIVQKAHLRVLEYQLRSIVWDEGKLLRRIVLNLSINFYRCKLENPPVCECVEKADKQGRLVGRGQGWMKR